jgi:hypothetical protein
MRRIALLSALASASALGMVATPAERQRGRLMRAPDHGFDGPAWFYGPNDQRAVFESANDVPAGWQDHPSKVKGAQPDPDAGTKTAVQPENGTTSAAEAAKTTTAKSQTQTAPKVAAATETADGTAPVAPKGEELDAEGHPFDATLHAATRSKTKDGLWRMKVGVKRPAPAPGYPLDL